MTSLLAIDPGSSVAKISHTGVVAIEFEDDLPPVVVGDWAVPHGIDGFREWYQMAVTSPLRVADVVVCEKFVNRGIQGADLSPLLIEGVVRFLRPDVVLQPAAGKNTGMTDEAMNRLGFTKTGFSGDHHQDRWEALRHGLLYLKNRKHMPTLELAYPR